MWEAWKVSGYLKRAAPATVKSLSQEPAEETSSKSPLPTEEFAIKPAGESSTCWACSRLRLQSPAPGTKPNNTKEKVQWWGGCLSGPRAWVQGTSTEKKKRQKWETRHTIHNTMEQIAGQHLRCGEEQALLRDGELRAVLIQSGVG